MRRWFIVSSAALLLAINFGLTYTVYAQGGQEGVGQLVKIPFTARSGDKFDVRVWRSQTASQANKPPVETSSSYEYEGEIIAAIPAGYRVRWVLRKGEINEPDPVSKGIKDELLRLFLNYPIDFETNEAGVPVRLLGWDELLQKFLPAVRSYVQKAERSPEQTALALRATDAIFVGQSAESAVSIFLEEAQLIGAAQHKALPLRQAMVVESKEPNWLSGGLIDAKTTWTMTRYDRAVGEAEIHAVMTLDPDSAIEGMRGFMRQLVMRTAPSVSTEELDSVMKEASFELSAGSETSIVIGLPDGWATKVASSKATRARAEMAASSFDRSRVIKWKIEVDRK